VALSKKEIEKSTWQTGKGCEGLWTEDKQRENEIPKNNEAANTTDEPHSNSGQKQKSTTSKGSNTLNT
jgi:hypothetical protein